MLGAKVKFRYQLSHDGCVVSRWLTAFVTWDMRAICLLSRLEGGSTCSLGVW